MSSQPQLAIIVYRPLAKHKPFQTAAEKKEVKLDIISYPQLRYDFSQDSTSITFNNQDLASYSAIYIKNAQKEPEQSTLVAEYCRQKQVPVCDQAFVQGAPWIDRKSFEYLRLSKHKLPIIKSVLAASDQLELVSAEIGFPCAAKRTDSSEGEGVYLVKDQEQLKHVFSQEKQRLLVQKFIKNTGDYRFFVIGEEVAAAMRRRRQDQDAFLNNISQGAKAVAYQPSKAEKQLALRAAQALKYDIAGVDLIKDNDQMKILEVNCSPGFSGLMKLTGIDIHSKIVRFMLKLAGR